MPILFWSERSNKYFLGAMSSAYNIVQQCWHDHASQLNQTFAVIEIVIGLLNISTR